jgi:polyhydroxyalkanoate synthase
MLAQITCSSLPCALTLQKKESPLWKLPLGLQRVLEQYDTPHLQHIARQHLQHFLNGVERYQTHPYQRALPEPACLWQQGTTRLLDYGSTLPTQMGRPILVIPSLVNRAYILDLMPERSFLRWLVTQGYRPLLVDWGSPDGVERQFGLDAYIMQRLEPCLTLATALQDTPVPVIGYCMGGMLALALALRRKRDVQSLVLLASPWDFTAIPEGQRRHLAAIKSSLERVLTFYGYLPVDVLQTLFTSNDPFGVMQKYSLFKQHTTDTDAPQFVAVEDWLNDGVALSAPVARECLFDWFLDNTPMNGRWQVGGLPIQPQHLTCPALLVSPTRDTIVPQDCAFALAKQLQTSFDCLTPNTGHIGMVAGRKALTEMWEPVAGWLQRY